MLDWGFGERDLVMSPLLDHGIFTQDGEAWKNSRQLLRPHLRLNLFKDLKVFKESTDELIEILRREDGDIDLQDMFFRFTLDIITAFSFGQSVQSLKNETKLAASFGRAQKFIVRRFRLGALYWFVGGQPYHEACADVHDFADRLIEQSQTEHSSDTPVGISRSTDGVSSSAHSPFLARLKANGLIRKEIRGQIINLLVAGRDTTACLLSWTL